MFHTLVCCYLQRTRLQTAKTEKICWGNFLFLISYINYNNIIIIGKRPMQLGGKMWGAMVESMVLKKDSWHSYWCFLEGSSFNLFFEKAMIFFSKAKQREIYGSPCILGWGTGLECCSLGIHVCSRPSAIFYLETRLCHIVLPSVLYLAVVWCFGERSTINRMLWQEINNPFLS